MKDKKVVDFNAFKLSREGQDWEEEFDEDDELDDEDDWDDEDDDDWDDEDDDDWDDDDDWEEDWDEDEEDWEEEEDPWEDEKLKDLLKTMSESFFGGRTPGLHDFFQVSEEEERMWYYLPEELPRLEDIDNAVPFEGPTFPSVASEVIRTMFRRQPEETKAYFLDRLECQIEEGGTTEETENEYMNAAYFFSEFHVEEAFGSLLELFISSDEIPSEGLGFGFDTFIHQHMSAVLYATFDGDVDALLRVMESVYMSDDKYDILVRLLAQLALDGVFSPEKSERLLRERIEDVKENHRRGSSVAQWIVLSGLAKKYQKELRGILKYRMSPMEFGTTRPDRFEKMVRDKKKVFCHEICETSLVMDDSILFGMYTPAVKVKPEIRQKAIREQEERIERFKREQAELE